MPPLSPRTLLAMLLAVCVLATPAPLTSAYAAESGNSEGPVATQDGEDPAGTESDGPGGEDQGNGQSPSPSPSPSPTPSPTPAPPPRTPDKDPVKGPGKAPDKDKGDQKTPGKSPDKSPGKSPGKAPQKNPGKPKGDKPGGPLDTVFDGSYLGAPVVTLADLSSKPTAAPANLFAMPFPCGEVWTGTTRGSHSPSVRSVDFNAGDDLGRLVVAPAAGVVTTAVTGRNRPSYGQFVVVEHAHGESTLYAHLDSVLVTVGDELEMGSPLGTVGSTGNSSGPHLHFEMRSGASVIDAWFDGVRFEVGSSQVSTNCDKVGIADIPLAGDVIGGSRAELVTFRRTGRPTFRIKRPGKSDKVVAFGKPSDQPLLGDWDGDGKATPGVREGKKFLLKQGRRVVTIKFGSRRDIAVVGDWDGDGTWDVGVRRPGSNLFKLRAADGTVTKMRLGDVDDRPVTGDWDGDGDTDLGVFDRETATFTLQKVDASGMFWLDQVQFGEPGDLPLAADWDGNGVSDLAIWDPATATYEMRMASSPAKTKAKVRRVQFGQGR